MTAALTDSAITETADAVGIRSSALFGVVSVNDAYPMDGENVLWIWDSAGQITAGDYFQGTPRDASANYARIKTPPTHWMTWPSNWPNVASEGQPGGSAMKTKMGIVGCLVNRSVRLVRAVWSDVGMDPKDAAQAFVAGVIMAIPVMAVVWATAWEFFFTFEGKKTYGKIMLVEDRKKVRLYSAHLPEKPRLRCE